MKIKGYLKIHAISSFMISGAISSGHRNGIRMYIEPSDLSLSFCLRTILQWPLGAALHNISHALDMGQLVLTFKPLNFSNVD